MAITRACAHKMISENIFQWNEHYPNVDAFMEDLEREELFVLLNKERVIGSITISSRKDVEYEAIDWLTEDGHQYYIHRLAVDPSFQHQGNAKKLMDFAEDYAIKNGATSVRLDTFSGNPRNERFYEARGYSKLAPVFFPKQSDLPFYCYERVFD